MSPEQVKNILIEEVLKHRFFKQLYDQEIIASKEAVTRISYKIKEKKKRPADCNRTFQDFIAGNRRVEGVGNETGLILFNHSRDLLRGSHFLFTGKDFRQYLKDKGVDGHALLVDATHKHHRTQHAHIIRWAVLQVQTPETIKKLIQYWCEYVKVFFHD